MNWLRRAALNDPIATMTPLLLLLLLPSVLGGAPSPCDIGLLGFADPAFGLAALSSDHPTRAGICHAADGDFAAAAVSFNASVDLDPDLATAHLLFGASLCVHTSHQMGRGARVADPEQVMRAILHLRTALQLGAPPTATATATATASPHMECTLVLDGAEHTLVSPSSGPLSDPRDAAVAFLSGVDGGGTPEQIAAVVARLEASAKQGATQGAKVGFSADTLVRLGTALDRDLWNRLLRVSRTPMEVTATVTLYLDLAGQVESALEASSMLVRLANGMLSRGAPADLRLARVSYGQALQLAKGWEGIEEEIRET